MRLPKAVKIVEVGPRDGLQNESRIIPADVKIHFIDLLSETGLKYIEASSFVSPKWIPQLSDGDYVFKQIKKKDTVHYSVLVPNLEGLHRAIKAGANEIAVFTAASETFCQKNTHCSLEESLMHCIEVIKSAKKENIKVRGYISCVMGCPYEGKISSEKVADIAEKLYSWGCYEISLGDTIGVGNPLQAQLLIDTVAEKMPRKAIAAHFHDTYGMALVNLFAVLQKGVKTIDASVNGLGGCPYAKGASGNVATEDVVHFLNSLNIETGINLAQLLKAGSYISHYLHKLPRSKLAKIKI